MRPTWTSIVIGALIIAVFSYIATCAYIRIERQTAFELVKIGDTEDSVIAHFGNPSVRESANELFSRYGSSRCQSPCAERLWFENRLALDIEAWSVSLGKDGRVVEKYHWVSP